jgi:hypothetical protein
MIKGTKDKFQSGISADASDCSVHNAVGWWRCSQSMSCVVQPDALEGALAFIDSS